MGRRWLTPLRLSIFLSRRAAKATPSATSRMKRGHAQLDAALRPGLLLGDGHALLEGGRVVGADLAADAVLERRDDLAARGVVLGVRGEDHAHVEGQPHRVALDLDVALLEDVEEPDLDAAGEVGQLVEGEDPAVGARQQAVVHGQLAGQVVAAAGGADGVDVADDVGDGHVRRGQLLHVALVGGQEGDRRLVAPLARRGRGSAGRAGRKRIVVDLAARPPSGAAGRAAW